MLCVRALGLVNASDLRVLGSEGRGLLEALDYEGLVGAYAQREAVICVRFFAGIRDRLLAAEPWVFARKSAALVRVTEKTPGWAHSFLLPSDCLKALVLIAGEYVWHENARPHVRPWTVEKWEQVGRLAVCRYKEVTLRYTARIADTDLWDPLFADAFCCSLAAEIVSEANILQPVTTRQLMEERAAIAARQARETGAVKAALGVPMERYGWHGFQDRLEPEYEREWGY
jgi:hypothetical protein